VSYRDQADYAAYHRAYRKKNAEKMRAYMRVYHEAHKEEHARMKHDFNVARREWLNERKAFQGCFICGEDRPWRLRYHHLDPSAKEVNVGCGHLRLSSILEELKHCIVVCANCHLDIHTDWGRTTTKGVIRLA